MKNYLFCLVLFCVTPLLAQQSTPKEAFLEKWENSKNYLVALAEAMPENHFDFKPTERQMSFKEQLVHIKDNMDWLSNTYFTASEYKREKAKLPATKAETIALLSEAFDATLNIIKNTSESDLSETVDFFSGLKSKLQILNLLQDHVSHHRGQLIVYLNLNNIEPPKYVGW
ncbi:putative damage-inducible protein DinB [Ulvibacter sp. MAR_2010_11]|uniref:DinB family protein n=1 Tax=Ulvibacter sp. MAR_2010_11 TaxID=1250229 RepID=UPI000C2B9678|nr:DinB family protein [Ulvibacter sp. MAR_2010_11]PKA82859.1 putative damage-inducible protein DinB [Ulvibacter sp. MAR_2010_11]